MNDDRAKSTKRRLGYLCVGLGAVVAFLTGARPIALTCLACVLSFFLFAQLRDPKRGSVLLLVGRAACGLVILVAGVMGLRHLDRGWEQCFSGLREGITPASPDSVEEANVGKLVYLTGDAEGPDGVRDPVYDLHVPGVRLARLAETYYEDSEGTDYWDWGEDGRHTPLCKRPAAVTAPTVRIGAFTLDPDLAAEIDLVEPLTLNNEQFETIRSAVSGQFWGKPIYLHNGSLYVGDSPARDSPQDGDVRVYFFATPPSVPVSIIARQGPGGFLCPYEHKWPGETLVLVGTVSLEDMLTFHRAVVQFLWRTAQLGCLAFIVVGAWVVYQSAATGLGPDNVLLGPVVRLGSARAVGLLGLIAFAASTVPVVYAPVFAVCAVAMTALLAFVLQAAGFRWDRADEGDLKPRGVVGKLGAGVVLWLSLVTVCAVGLGTSVSVREWQSMGDWVRTPCTVTACNVLPVPRGARVYCDVYVTYSYSYESDTFVGHQFAHKFLPVVRLFEGPGLAGSVVSRLEPGPALCYVNPRDPAETVLTRIPNGVAFGHGSQWAVLCLLVPLLIVSMAMGGHLSEVAMSQWVWGLFALSMFCAMPYVCVPHLLVATLASLPRLLVTVAVTLPWLAGWAAGLAYLVITGLGEWRASLSQERAAVEEDRPGTR